MSRAPVSTQAAPGEKFPTLAKLSSDRPDIRNPTCKAVIENIRDYASSKKYSGHQTKLIDELRAFAPLTPSERKPPLGRPSGKVPTAQDDDNHPILKDLHGALGKYGECGGTHITAKFRVKTQSLLGEDSQSNPAFSIIFLAHPHQESHETGWKISLVSVKRCVYLSLRVPQSGSSISDSIF